MKIEHKLSSAVIEHVRESREQIGQLETQYLQAMGQTRELQIEIGARRRELQNALALVIKMERLPQSQSPYMLNNEGTALLGEIADSPQMGVGAGIPAEGGNFLEVLPADEGNLAEAQTGGFINGSGHRG